MNGNVALLIDWENIKISTEKHLSSPPDIITLKKIARRYGKIGVAKAYANWAYMEHEGEMERFSLQNIEPVFVQTRIFTNDIIKGSSDIRLACDCIEILLSNPEISAFVLASGDGGFKHVIEKIKAYGKQAISIGIRAATNAGLGEISNELIFYDDWTAGLKVGAGNPKVSKALTEFKRAVEDIRAEKSNNSLQAVKAYILKSNPDFNEEEIGIPTFRHLAYLAEMKGDVRIDSISEPARAYLSNENRSEEGLTLHSGVKWNKFINALTPNTPYNFKTLEEITTKNGIYVGEEANTFVRNSQESNILWFKRNQYFNKALEKVIEGKDYFLNMNHPKVQVYMTGKIKPKQKQS